MAGIWFGVLSYAMIGRMVLFKMTVDCCKILINLSYSSVTYFFVLVSKTLNCRHVWGFVWKLCPRFSHTLTLWVFLNVLPGCRGKWDCGVWAIMSDLSEIRQQFEKRVLSSDTAVKTAKWDQLCMLHIQWSTAGGVELHAGNRSWGYPRQILSHRFCIHICLWHICEWNYHLVSLVQVSV